VKPVLEIIEKFDIHGLAHITGGGLIENVPRALNSQVNATIEKNGIDVLPIFKHIIEQGVSEEEMWGTFNMGVGFIIIASSNDAANIIAALQRLQQPATVIGSISAGSGKIILK